MKIQYLQTFAKNLHDFAKKKKQLDNIVSKNIWNHLFFLPGGSQNAPIGPDPKKCSLLYFGKSSISFKKSFRALRFVSDSTKISKNRPGMAREITQRRPNVDRTCSVRVGLLFWLLWQPTRPLKQTCVRVLAAYFPTPSPYSLARLFPTSRCFRTRTVGLLKTKNIFL